MKLNLKRIEKPFQFEVTNESGNQISIDAAPNIGGTNAGFRPMELLAAGLAGCVAIDVLLILEKKKINTDSFAIQIDASRKNAVPSPFDAIHLLVSVDSKVDTIQLNKTMHLVIDKYCSVKASLRNEIAITFEITP